MVVGECAGRQPLARLHHRARARVLARPRDLLLGGVHGEARRLPRVAALLADEGPHAVLDHLELRHNLVRRECLGAEQELVARHLEDHHPRVDEVELPRWLWHRPGLVVVAALTLVERLRRKEVRSE